MKTYNFHDFVKQDSEFFRILKRLPKPDKDGPWIAGGSIWKSIENQPLDCDLDFFFASPQQQEVYLRIMRSIPYVNHILSEKKNGYNTTFGFHIYDNGYNKTIPIQYVSFRYASTLEEILDQFDFTVCQFGFDGETLFTGDNSFDHLKERKVVFHNIHDTAATKIHLNKYLNKGFVISPDQQKIFDDIIIEKKSDDFVATFNEGYPPPITPIFETPPITFEGLYNTLPPQDFNNFDWVYTADYRTA